MSAHELIGPEIGKCQLSLHFCVHDLIVKELDQQSKSDHWNMKLNDDVQEHVLWCVDKSSMIYGERMHDNKWGCMGIHEGALVWAMCVVSEGL